MKNKGIDREKKIEFQEKNKQDKKIIYVSLTEENEMKLKELSSNIEKLFKEDMPPKVKKVKECRKYAYYEYCYI